MGIKSWFQRTLTPEIETKETTTFSPELIENIQFGAFTLGYPMIYRTQPSVYSVVEFLSWGIAGIGLKVYRRDSDNERTSLSGGPIADLLSEPAPGLTYEELMHTTVADLCIFGNSYWLKVGNGSNRAILPLNPMDVTPRGGSPVRAAAYDLKISNQPSQEMVRRVPADQVVHFRRYNPDDRRIGLSPLEPLRRILKEEQEASSARADMWKNQARIEGYLQRPQDAPLWSDVQRKRFREDWQAVHAGRGNTGKTAVLEDGMIFKEASWSPREAEFIEGRKLTLETVARAFNIPVSLLGLTETSTFASQKEFHKQLYVDTFGPWLRALEGKIDAEFVPWFTNDQSTYVEFNVQEKLRGAFEEQIASLIPAVGVPWLSVNRVRAIQNEPPIGDPDDPENPFNSPVQPLNILYGTPNNAPPGKAPPTELPASGPRGLQAADIIALGKALNVLYGGVSGEEWEKRAGEVISTTNGKSAELIVPSNGKADG